MNEILNDENLSWNVRDELKGLSVPEIMDHRMDYGHSIAIENLTGSLNVGAIIRSAEIFGVSEIYIIGKRRYDRRSTVGAHNYIDIIYVDSVMEIPQTRYLIGCENDYAGRSRPLYDAEEWINANLNPDCVFLFGSESEGLSKETLDHCDVLVSLPQTGVLRCLNVASAAAVILYLCQRRGMETEAKYRYRA